MKSIKISLIFLLIAVWGFPSPVHAQSDLQIGKAFEQYGQLNGVVMVELTDEALGDYDFALFRSLTITNNPASADFIRKCLARDEVGARKVKQVVTNGIPTSVYLQLPRKGKLYRLILFNETSKQEHKVTLIYIESETDSENILKFILKKK